MEPVVEQLTTYRIHMCERLCTQLADILDILTV